MLSAKKILNREEICSACLEYDSTLFRITDEYIKEVHKCFTGDYDNDVDLYLCNYCKHTIIKTSKFISMCVQSYAFLTRNVESSEFDSCEVAEEKALLQNSINLSRTKTSCVSVPFHIQIDNYNNDIFTITNNEDVPVETQFINPILKQENIDEDSDDPLVTCIENVEIEYPAQFKQETIQSTSEINTMKPGKTKTTINHEIDIKEENLDEDSEDSLSDCTNNEDVELPTEFENYSLENANNEKSENITTPSKAKALSPSTINLNKNIIETKLTREEQIKELEEKKNSQRYLKAIYKCEKCALNFPFEKSLQAHMMKHDESQGSFECWLCHIRYPKKVYLKKHCDNHSTKLKCKLCHFECHTALSMRNHLEIHAGVTHTCEICYKVFKYRNTLINHLEIHKFHKEFKCQQCDKRFFTKKVLKQHEHIHTDIRPYNCETCGKAFKSKSTLKKHMKTHNEKIITGEHYCVECNKYFNSESSLKSHLKNSLIHTDSSSLIYGCNQCPKMCKSQNALDHHIKEIHERVLKYPCSVCGTVFRTQSSRSHHKRRVHEGYVEPLKYGCPTCDKCFKTKPTLENHIRTHTGERPFECQLCDWKFTQKVALNTHIKLKHSKDNLNSPNKKLKKPA